MNDLLETYDKNRKKHLLSEVTATGATGTFVGQKGDIIDRFFAGPFHPVFGNIKKLLDKQIDDKIAKRMYTDDNTPQTEQDFFEIDWKYEYDEYVKQDNSKFTNTSQTNMQLVDIDIKYDEVIDEKEKSKKFINNTNDWKSIYDTKKY